MPWQTFIKRNRFAVLGRVGMDLYADPPGTRIEDGARFTAAIGGSAANIAVALVRQGAPAALLTRVADDAIGRYCIAELNRYGVGTGAIRPAAAEARNSLAVVETRAIDCQSVLYRSGAADLDLSPDDITGIDFRDIGALIVTGTALASPSSRRAALLTIDRARQSGALVVLDIDYRPGSWPSHAAAASAKREVAGLADIVIGNDTEFDLIADAPGAGHACARGLAAQGKAFVIYKMGAEGSETFHGTASFRTGIAPVTARKPMGAGDGFMGGLMAALAQGAPLPTAVQRGSATAAIIVAGIGCAPASPTSAELTAFLATHSIWTDNAHPPL
jgi:5-dehydro-2-deoxygluconokinase